jgi:DNA-binding NarL/FixJ family response regulator
MRIILALKDADLRLSIELLIREEPGILIVGTAINAQGLLALIKTSCPELVILDCDLPGDPLLKVVETVQEFESSPEFILLVGNMEGKEDYDKDGTHAYLVKGDPPEKLLNAVRQFNK